MKKYLLILFVLGATTLFAQDEASFSTVAHSFGKIKQHSPATYTFTYTNKTGKPAIIEMATAECGCTTPEYVKGAILKGKTSDIKVTYNAETLGTFSKKVTVKFVNVPTPVILTISGEVEASK